jgi:hypothetical protein
MRRGRLSDEARGDEQHDDGLRLTARPRRGRVVSRSGQVRTQDEPKVKCPADSHYRAAASDTGHGRGTTDGRAQWTHG